MSLLDDFQRWSGENRARRLRPIQEMQMDLAIKKQQELDALKAQQAAEALQRVIALQQQQKQAQGTDAFGIDKQLALHQARNQAGIDPVAMLRTKMFEEAAAKIQNPAARINIAQGKEYKPVSYSGGVFYNPYDSSNPLISTTGKYSAETRQAQAKAKEAEIRQKVFAEKINEITDPLLLLDAVQNKSVFNVERAEVEGEDGTTRQTFAALTPSGGFVEKAFRDTEGKPLKIPAQSGSKPTADMLNTEYYAKLWNKTPAETARILKSRANETPEQAWSTIVRGNVINPFTKQRLSANDLLSSSLEQWVIERPGEALPDNIQETIKNLKLSDKDKKTILAQVEQYNQAVSKPVKQTAPTATLPATPTPTPVPTTVVTPAITVPKPTPRPVTAPVMPATLPVPDVPPTETQPLTPMAIQTAWSAIQNGKQPEEVQQTLLKQGFDLSPESVNIMAIDAVNSGVPVNVLQQYLSSIGIQWQP